MNLIKEELNSIKLREYDFMYVLMYVCMCEHISLVSNKMLRHISVQFLFQMGLLVYLLLIGAPHFGVHEDSLEHLTIIFNTFVFCQVLCMYCMYVCMNVQ